MKASSLGPRSVLKPLRHVIRKGYRKLGYDLFRWPPLLEELDGHLSGLLPRLSVNCVLDVGAHWGEYASSLRALGYEGRIVSFEPVHDNAVCLRARASGDSRWIVKEMALGRLSGRKLLNVPGDTVLASFLDPTEFALENFADSAPLRQEEVVVSRVDEILDECTTGIDLPRVYLKMDTQGWDLEVFAGASGRVDQIVALQSELSVVAIGEGMPTYLQALAEYQQHGFELTGLYPIARDKRARIIEFDAVMVRPGT